MQYHLMCFVLTRTHLLLQVKEKHELKLLRSKLLQRKLHRLPAEGEEEGGRAAEARNAPRHRASRASPPIAPGRRSRERLLGGHRDWSMTGNLSFRIIPSFVFHSKLNLMFFADRHWKFPRPTQHLRLRILLRPR